MSAPGEHHFVHRIGWLRAAVLGANDGLVAGAMSMAAGEYVSVSSQADTERADLHKERQALDHAPEAELAELARIYEARGVEPELAMQVARQLTAHDDLASHARDELGISVDNTSRPIQAAVTSAATFATGAALPLAAVALVDTARILPVVAVSTVLGLALLGALSARAGGASVLRACVRVTFWGALAMAVTAGAGSLFGATV